MPELSHRQQLGLILLLALSMIMTRPHNLSSLHHFPATSWAVFFILGVLVRRFWPFIAMTALAVAIDYIAITWFSVSDFCVTTGYVMLAPAFLSLWLGGRWYANQHRDSLTTLPVLAIAVILSAFAAELFSSGGFYFLGGRFADPTIAGFLPRLAQYFPGMLGTMAMYVTAATLIYSAWLFSRGRSPSHSRSS